MSSAIPLPTLMTVDEFQAWVPPLGKEGWRWHLIDGEPVGMAPAGIEHGIIQLQAGTIINMHLQKIGRCVGVITPGVVPKARSKRNQLVPDIGVSCARQPGGNTLVEPVLLVEILSPSNAAITRGNVDAFKTIPSVQEILVIDSRKVSGVLHRRGGQGEWPDDPEELDALSTVELRSIDLKVAMPAFYATSSLRAD